MKKILAISGSNHQGSINTKLLKQTVSHFQSHTTTLLDLIEYPLPIYSQDIESNGIPDNVQLLWDIFSEHDALVIAVPEHNGFMPAFLKNVIDWLSRLSTTETGFFGTHNIPVLLLSTSPGANGGATSLQTLHSLMPWWGAEVKATFSLGCFGTHYIEGQFTSDTDLTLKRLATEFEGML